jgi:hypothetical protein
LDPEWAKEVDRQCNICRLSQLQDQGLMADEHGIFFITKRWTPDVNVQNCILVHESDLPLSATFAPSALRPFTSSRAAVPYTEKRPSVQFAA